MEPHRLALPSGFRIENYEIQAVLGKGGFGITYAGYDWTLHRQMAIKELLPDSIATRIEGSTVVAMSPSHEESWQWARERFIEEARTLAGFRHPNIIAVHRLIEANGTAYIVMDHLEGESYEARLQRIGREPDQESLMGVIGPILGGLQEVHSGGLLHRDIKPENILFDKRGNPVLIDFGSARATVGATMAMTSIVTHGYSPIEQYQTKGKMGPWTDIYALGAVMCRAITGEKPPVAAERVEEDDYRKLSERFDLTGFSVEFLKWIDRGLEIKSKDRPQSISDWQVPEAKFATLSPPPLPRTDRQVPAMPQIQESKGKPSYFFAPLTVVIAGVILLTAAIPLTSSITKETYEQTQKESNLRRAAEIQAIIQNADETVRIAKESESEALDRAQKLESEQAAEKQAYQAERENLQRQLDSATAELARIKQQAMFERRRAEIQKTEDEIKHKENLLRAEAEKKSAIEKARNSITAADASRLNQGALAAAGRTNISLSSTLTPTTIQFGQTAQLILRVTDVNLFRVKPKPHKKYGDLNISNKTDPRDTLASRLPLGGRLWNKVLVCVISAEKPGRHEIPSFEVEVDGLTLHTSPLVLEVSP